MILKDNEVARMQRLLRDIATESRKEKQRKHRIENLASQVSTIIRKAQRRTTNKIQ